MDNRYNNNEHVIEQISAYLDGALDDVTSNDVLAHIDDCAICHAEYAEVRATRYLLRSVTVVQPPRAFTLTPEMVKRKVWQWERLLVPRNVPRLATGSVMAFALVMLILIGNVGGIASFGNNNLAMTSSEQGGSAAKLMPPPIEGLVAESTPAADISAGAPVNGNQNQTPQPLPIIAVEPTTVTETRASAQVTATAMLADQMLRPMATPADGMGGGNEYGIPSPPLQQMSPSTGTIQPQDFISPERDSSTDQPTSDGSRVLIFSLTSLLVALGAAFAVGAVVAARR